MNDDKYVVVRTVSGHTWATQPFHKAFAVEHFHWVIGESSTYAPHTGNRVRVMAAGEWARLQVEAAQR